jgi:hypothetical protein
MATGTRNKNLAAALKATVVAGKGRRGILRVKVSNGKLVVSACTLMVMGHLLSAFLKSFSVSEQQRLTL